MSDFHQFFVRVTDGRGSILLSHCCGGFMDNVIFADNELYAGVPV